MINPDDRAPHTAASAEPEHFFVVMNAASGSGGAPAAQHEMAEVFAAADRPCDFLLVDDPARLPQVARRAVEEAVRANGAVVAVGGDGTINAVAQAVLPTGRPLGIVPQGTFNYSGRAHGIPTDPREAAEMLLRARLKPVQVGLVNDRVFLVNASLGLYPEVMQDREQFKRRYGRRRSIAIASALITISRGYRQLTLELDCDGLKDTVRALTLFVGNNPLQLEQVGLPEAEDVQRLRLAGVLVPPISAAALLWLAVRGAFGQLGEDDKVRDFAFRNLTVRPLRRVSSRGMKVAIDGEVTWLRPPLQFSIAANFLRLMTPA